MTEREIDAEIVRRMHHLAKRVRLIADPAIRDSIDSELQIVEQLYRDKLRARHDQAMADELFRKSVEQHLVKS